MGNLTTYLQDQFELHCPKGWICRREVAVLPEAVSRSLGYAPRADVLLENRERRLWVEFEVRSGSVSMRRLEEASNSETIILPFPSHPKRQLANMVRAALTTPIGTLRANSSAQV